MRHAGDEGGLYLVHLHAPSAMYWVSRTVQGRDIYAIGRGGHSDLCLQLSAKQFAGCLMSQQHASVSQGWICSDNSTCCHTEIEVAD